MPRYYIEARSGESWEGKTFHGDEDCQELGDRVRPVPGRVAGDDAEFCTCVPFGDASADSSSGTDEGAESGRENEDSQPEGDTSDGEEPATCAGTTAGGDPCTIEVESAGDYCHHHGE